MFRLNTDAIERMSRQLLRSELLQAARPLIMRSAAELTRELIARRIEQEGVNSAGNVMQSKAPQRYGAYSKRWGSQRASTGHQTGHIDFTYTGEFMQHWAVMAPAKVGFTSDEMAARAEKLEGQFGVTFGLTDGERQQVNAFVQESQLTLLRGK